MSDITPTFYEFFAGGGMARAGLGAGWTCMFANEFDTKKGAIYNANWGEPSALKLADVRTLATADAPGVADLIWASFPCQDLSLAGAGAGLKGDRSGTFWPFWGLIEGLITEERAPKLIVLENVYGMLTSHGGKDFAAICSAYAKAGYRFGALIVDACHFVPQSRPRFFMIGVREDLVPQALYLTSPGPSDLWHPKALQNAYGKLRGKIKENWVWWRLAAPEPRTQKLSDLIEDQPLGVEWHTAAETAKLLKMMSPLNRKKVQAAKKSGQKMVGTIYKRTRRDEFGVKVQRAEIRFDDIAGCLRTPAGGSSRQVIMIVEGKSVRSRLISPRETARLMGLPDDYMLPSRYNEAYHLTGDGVAVPVVRHLAQHIFEPVIFPQPVSKRAAA